MNKRRAIAAGQALLAALAIVWVDRAAFAQNTALTVPQSIRFEHAAIIERLTKEAVRAGPTGVVVQKALILIVDHFAREEQFVFPPLGLLDEIAEGKLPDDATKQLAIKMAERTKASKDRLHEDHVQIDSLMNELRESATKVREVDLVAFASSVAAHNLSEAEVMEPATIVIGDYLRSKLPPGR